jgi:hypothetical protein
MLTLVMLSLFGTIACIFPARYAAAMHLSKPRMTILANFGESPFHALGWIEHSRAPIGQDRRRGHAPIVGYYAPATKTRTEEGLGHRGAAVRSSGWPRYITDTSPV